MLLADANQNRQNGKKSHNTGKASNASSGKGKGAVVFLIHPVMSYV